MSGFRCADFPDCVVAISSIHLIRSVLRSVPLPALVCVLSSLKRRTGIIHSLPAPSHNLIRSSHPFNRPALLPVHRHGWRGVFSLLAVLPSCGLCGSSVLAAYRAAASRHLSRLGAIALGSVRLACPLSSWLSCLLSPCRHAVAVASSHHLIALRPVLSIRLAGRCLAVGRHRVGSSPVLFACRPCGVSSCPHGVVSFRPVLAVGAWCVGCVDGATACRSCGIFVLSIGCIYRLIGFLICQVCLLLLLSVSSYR